MKFLETTVLKNGNPGFEFFRIDDDLTVEMVVGLGDPLEFEEVLYKHFIGAFLSWSRPEVPRAGLHAVYGDALHETEQSHHGYGERAAVADERQ